jgi:hypothetical protein
MLFRLDKQKQECYINSMNTSHGFKLDIEGLRALYAADSTARALLDDFASRQRNQRTTKVKPLVARLTVNEEGPQRKDVVKVLKKLQVYGCGRFIVGRKGHDSRFEWIYDLVSVGKAAAGRMPDAQPIQSADEQGVEEDDGPVSARREAVEHLYQLRPDWQVIIRLPSDLTSREALRLSEFIKTLPFDSREE